MDDGETWFARLDRESPGRLYLGVAATGRAMKAILLRAYVALLAAANRLYDPDGEEDPATDAWMTLVGYFNSLRELGGMRRLVEDEVRTRCDKSEERKPVDWTAPHPWFRNRKVTPEPVELTSREDVGSVKRAKARLAASYRDAERVDVALASSMISAGVDIDRLGLLVVAGQPKSTSEYIQASSRVGRQSDRPGLVVTCFNLHKPRDRSHYERFPAYHQSFYRFVEASSLTPFSGPALDRGLAGTLVAMTRQRNVELTPAGAAMRIAEHRELRALESAVRQVWAILQAATAATLPAFRTIPDVQKALGNASDADVLTIIDSVRQGGPPLREPLRTAEFRQLVGAPTEVGGELPPAGEDFFARAATPHGGPLDGIARLVLIPKLREVRVQIGFTRIEPVMPDLEGEFSLEVQSAPLSLTQDWLPASEVRGEGIFLQLDEASVWRWEQRPEVQARERALRAGYSGWLSTLKGEPAKMPPFPGARFYLLHSLAHLLLTAISLECGYAASAIRERIYCAPADKETPMAAILLSTGSPGTEGTLGGLVEEGRNLRRHLRRARRLGELCSNDPVCAGHSPQSDPAERYLEGAACHGCLFVAESSCERFNRYLDRSLVVPTLGHPPGLAFFASQE